MKVKYLFSALLGCTIGCTTAWGQATAQINGTVSDATGALIPGVDVTATHTATGISRTTLTNESGTYILPNLPVGPYRMEMSLAGFRMFVQTGIILEVNSTRVVNAVLELGQVTETVEVQADAVMVETRATGVGEVITNTQILELPLVGRETQDLIALVGASAQTGQETQTSRSFPGVARFTIAGGSDRGNSYTLDGASHNETRQNLGLPLPFPDALQEFKVETSALPAQYGFRSGGAINALTKSGTNQFHGGLFWFVRNEVFNARNFFADERDPLKRNQFGGTIGGPIAKNKMFFFFGFQGTADRRSPSATNAIVPTPAMINGDFRTFASAACQGRDISLPPPFVNNVAPASALSAAAVNMANRLPIPNDECGNTTFGVPVKNDEAHYVAKVDYQLKNNHSMFWRYFGYPFNAAVGTDFTNNALATAVPGKDDLFQAGAVADTITFGSNKVNSFRASWNRTATQRVKPTYFDVDDLGIKAWHLSPRLDDMIFVTVANAFVVGSRTSASSSYRETGYQVSNDLSIIKGNHQLNFGGNWQAFQQNSASFSQTVGVWQFNPVVTPLSMADFMLGQLTFLQQGAQNIGPMRTKIFGLYAQDSWKLSPRLTLSMGLRWEPYLDQRFERSHDGISLAVNNYIDIDMFLANVRTEKFANAPAGIFYEGDPQFPAGSNSTTVITNKLDKFAPRLGLTWDPLGDGRTAVRAAYGIFYETQAGEFGITFGQGAPWAGFAQVDNTSFDDPWSKFPGGNPFPFAPGLDAPYPQAGQYAMTFPETQPPYVQQWNLGIQREVTRDLLVSISYLGNQMTHLYGGLDLNPAVYIPGNGDSNGDCFANVRGRRVSLNVGAGRPCSTTAGANRNARRTLTLLDPTGALGGSKYGYVNAWDFSGTRSYHGMLLSMNKRFSSNFSLTANYTWSHCISDPANNLLHGQSGVGVWNDPTNRAYDRGNCNSAGDDYRHIVNSTTVVNTPSFANRTVHAVFGDWRVSGILRARSGSWQNPTFTGESSGTGANVNAQRPNLVSNNLYGNQCKTDLRSSNPTCRWYNRAAFEVPALGTLGTAGRAILLGPGSWTVDFGLSRVFRVTEAHNVEFRMDASNVLNHANFLNPNTNISGATFGRITAAEDPRIIQFGMKYNF
jgi:hypothetical protein